MRFCKWPSIALAALTIIGCHPRYGAQKHDLDGPGTGGSGSLDSIRTRILALIATGQYHQAYEYLELAANLTEAERERLHQMISAAERGLIPFLEDKLPHISRQDVGHFPLDTAEARELIQTTAIEANFVGIRRGVERVYQVLLESGVQVWVYVRDGTIRDAGRNDLPRPVEGLLK